MAPVNRQLAGILLILLALTAILRFTNLGYSDYHGDEFKAFILPDYAKDETVLQFLLKQRKGPMQFVISALPYLITGDYRFELAQRFPFALASCLAVAAFFLFTYTVTNDRVAAAAASGLFLSNGFISGFGRIAQYQNLNLLFSFCALIAYSKLRSPSNNQRKQLVYSLVGTLFWSLSILAHWDAILILPIVIILAAKPIVANRKLLFANLILGCLLVLPFMIPYLAGFRGNTVNQGYFSRRIGVDFVTSNLPLYKALSELYNPYLTLPVLILMAALGTVQLKKSWPFLVWFAGVFLLFELFVKSPGTHIYNFMLPLFTLAGIGVSISVKPWQLIHRISPSSLLRKVGYIWTTAVGLLLFGIFAFMYVQTYYLFVDHSKEYPYQAKEMTLFGHSYTASAISDPRPGYMRGSYLPLFGFPHNRFWREINQYLSTTNTVNNETLRFITNEDKAFCEKYIDAKYGISYDDDYYAVGIIRPTNFIKDAPFTNIGNKKLVKTFSLNTEIVVKIYRVRSQRT